MGKRTSGVERAGRISFRQLRLFEAIGDFKSVRRASEECSLSQPAVTQALAKLEEQIGVSLVDRRASGSYLNPLGSMFYSRVRRFFEQIDFAVIDLGVASSPVSARPIVNRLTRSQVRTLVARIETGSFERASEMLGISAASLQRAARDLEGNLNKTLYYRTAAGMLVSPLGIEFGRKMKLALQEIEWGIEELEAAMGGTSRQIVVGAMPFGGSVLLASVLDDFLRMYPKADVRITNDSATEMSNSLRAGDVDFMIGLLPKTAAPDVISEAFAETPYSVVVRRGHPLTRKGKVSLEDLVAYDWVVGMTGSSRRACFDGLFADFKAPPTQVVTCALHVVRHLLARSDRLTLMTSYELVHEDTQLRALPFGPIAPVPSIGITMRANWLPTRMHRDFIDLLRAHLAQPAVPRLKAV
jgi:LysR family transcriptional regulator of gallate degradation